MQLLAIATHSNTESHQSWMGNGPGGCLRSEGMNSTDIAFAGAAEQARMLGAGTITSIALTEPYMQPGARPDRFHRSPGDPAPAHQLALGTGMGRTVRPDLRAPTAERT